MARCRAQISMEGLEREKCQNLFDASTSGSNDSTGRHGLSSCDTFLDSRQNIKEDVQTDDGRLEGLACDAFDCPDKQSDEQARQNVNRIGLNIRTFGTVCRWTERSCPEVCFVKKTGEYEPGRRGSSAQGE